MKQIDIFGTTAYIDVECKACVENLKIWKINNGQIDDNEIFVLEPDYNSAGVLTHYHVIIMRKGVNFDWIG